MLRLFVHRGLMEQFAQKKWWTASESIRSSGLLAFSSFIFILLYVFVLSPYENFLYNDMLGYWQRAIERFHGETYQETQFLAWAPGYHIFIAEALRLFHALRLDNLIRYETFIWLNIAVFAVSVFAIHRIAIKWFNGDARFSLAVTLLYGFGFPAWYFNAFLLADNLAAPLLVIALALVYLKTAIRYLVVAAGLFAFAAFIRPSVAPYGLCFVIGLLVMHRFSVKFLVRAAVFSGVFFALVFLGMTEVSRISKGKVEGLSANGGLDFFIANSRIYRIDLNYDGWHNFVVVPALSWKPEQGFYKSRVPYYRQEYYYNLGWEFIKRNPERIVLNLEHVKHLFFADMLPTRNDAPGFSFFRPIWDVLKFACFLTAFFFIWLWQTFSVHEKKLAAFMLSTIGITFIVSYLFTGEPRYTYSIIFMFYLIAFKVLQFVFTHRARIEHALPRVAILLAGLWFSGKVLAFIVTPSYPNHIQASFSGETNEHVGQNFQLEKLYFPHASGKALSSVDKNMKLFSAGELKFVTDLHLSGEEQNIKLDVHSSWPITVKVDEQIHFRSMTPYFFAETPAFIQLSPGTHRVEVIVNYVPREGGLSLNYNYIDKSDGWVYRDFLGVDKGPISFTLPKENQNE